MYRHSLLWHLSWLFSPFVQTLLVALMMRRKLNKEFPFFFAFSIASALLDCTLFGLDHLGSVSGELYWHVSWFGQSLVFLLRFGIIGETIAHLLRPYPALRHLGIAVFRWAMVVLILVAVAVARFVPAVDGTPPLLAGLLVLMRTVNLVQCGLIVVLFVFSSYFGLSWRSRVFGIALGLGIIASVNLALTAIGTQIGATEKGYIHDFVVFFTYDTSLLIWLAYFLLPEPAPRAVNNVPANNLQIWNQEIEKFLLR